jgi:hypothetical protein
MSLKKMIKNTGTKPRTLKSPVTVMVILGTRILLPESPVNENTST